LSQGSVEAKSASLALKGKRAAEPVRVVDLSASKSPVA
jgi:hypothetical protein